MAIIENFKVYTDRKAKIVIIERTGTVVVGGDIQLSPVAIGHGDLAIEISDTSKKKGESEQKNSLYFYRTKKYIK